MALNKKDLRFILEALEYTKLKFENYEQYPTYEFKQGRINDVDEVIIKVRELL